MTDQPPSSNSLVAVVLAAGKGTRFGGDRPKVLQPLAGRPVLAHVLDTLNAAGIPRSVLVVGYLAEMVQDAFPESETVLQREQRGTGHALQQAREATQGASTIVVANGDLPLVSVAMVRSVLEAQQGVAMAALSCIGGEVTGMGRVKRDAEGDATGVVEEKEATAEERAITEWNVGLYAFDAAWLWPHLDALAPSQGGEIYLTDLFAIAAAERSLVFVPTTDIGRVRGINTPADLAALETLVQSNI